MGHLRSQGAKAFIDAASKEVSAPSSKLRLCNNPCMKELDQRSSAPSSPAALTAASIFGTSGSKLLTISASATPSSRLPAAGGPIEVPRREAARRERRPAENGGLAAIQGSHL
eukprot:CAMPEP_0183435406 /NCGR_PEP_ID=MMETSP0370-20130417/67914_1 /TAXON_ID=268820 /ORGANISM="Peridinium aciculiferum, Strain PAER-2" /LENGTH=112 /DNA_ID=CAMNT_0025622491 /DNA_START=323 /DNA_END=658 /DNA_ORIENTATION=-